MSRTRTQLRQDTLLLLGEDYASSIGELESGVDATPVVAAFTTVDTYIDRAKDFLCSYLPFVAGWGQYPALPVGTYKLDLHNATIAAAVLRGGSGDGSILSEVESVTWNGVAVNYCALEALILEHSDAEYPQNAATVDFWYPDGQGIGLYQAPNIAHNLNIYGYVKAPSITAGTESVTWATEDKARLLAVGAAALLANDNKGSSDIEARIPGFVAEFDSRTMAMWDGIPIGRRKAWYPTLPGLMGGTLRQVKKA